MCKPVIKVSKKCVLRGSRTELLGRWGGRPVRTRRNPHTSSAPLPHERQESMVRMLPSGPDPLPMIKPTPSTLRLKDEGSFDPEGQDLIVGKRLNALSDSPSPAVTLAVDDFDVKGDAEPPGQA